MPKEFLLLGFLAVAALTPAANASDGPGPTPRPMRILLDTDIESDVDDVGAIAMVHALADRGEIALLGILVCAQNPWSTLCVDRLNHYFRRPELPLGRLTGPGVDRESLYAQKVAETFPGGLEKAEDAPDAVATYRRLLAAEADGAVVLLTIGYLTNLRDLLASEPDKHSPLGGRDLVAQKVRLWVCMGGQFPSGREANIRWDTAASLEAITHWPTEIHFVGWEIGLMDTGADIRELPDASPVRRAYEWFGRIPHKSWDQVATLYAARGLDGGPARHWELSPPGRLVIDPEDGSNTWRDEPGGPHRRLIARPDTDATVVKEIDALMMHRPE